MNIDKIEVSENDISFVIYPNDNIVVIKGKKYNIDTEIIEEFIRTIRLWKNEYYDSSYKDGNKFEVAVYSNNKKTLIIGNRNVPDNYDSFSRIVRCIYGRR